MKKILAVFYFLLLLAGYNIRSQEAIIINHNNTDIAQIPDNWLDSARTKLRVHYYRRSHGSQVYEGGMAALKRYSVDYGLKYNYSTDGAADALYITDDGLSVDYDPDIWASSTRTLLDNPANADINVVMWAWSYLFYVSDVQGYLDTMETFIADYGINGTKIQAGYRTVPVTFVFQTACSLGDDARNEIVYNGNQLIRQHCVDNNRVLYDFNDIECYNPDGVYFGDGNPDGSYSGERRLNDDMSYNIDASTRGNWGIEWMTANPDAELSKLAVDNICTSCAHSDGYGDLSDNSRIHCVLKGQAAWWLWAKLAGWGTASLTATPDQQLNETGLDLRSITLALSGDQFVDATLNMSNFQLNNFPPGVSIESLSYTDATHVELNLAFDGTNFDVDYTTCSVTIMAAELTAGANLTSNELTVEAFGTVIIAATLALTETNLDGAVISVLLEGESFDDATLEAGNFQLNNAPVGASVQSVGYTDDTHAEINIAFDGTNFDTDITNFSITIMAVELNISNTITSNQITIEANEATLNISSSEVLIESNLDAAVINILLNDDSFADATLATTNFQLNNAPIGTSVQSVSYTDATHAELTLAFDGTDFDTDITDFSVTVLAVELSNSSNLSSNDLTISANNESVGISSNPSLSESNLDAAVINVLLNDDSFADATLATSNFQLNNAPVGTSVQSVSYTDATHAELTLAFDGTDFDTDITDFSVTVLAVELSNSSNLSSNDLTISANNESVGISSNPSLSESNLDAAVINVLLNDDSFADATLATTNFQLNNAPIGTSVQSVSYTNATHAELTLAFDGTDFDTDINNFSITVQSSELVGVEDLISNELSITAEIESGIQTLDAEGSTLLYPNPNSGVFVLELNVDRNTEYDFKIIDAVGKVLYNKKLQVKIGENLMDFDVKELAEGSYYMIINTGTSIKRHSFHIMKTN